MLIPIYPYISQSSRNERIIMPMCSPLFATPYRLGYASYKDCALPIILIINSDKVAPASTLVVAVARPTTVPFPCTLPKNSNFSLQKFFPSKARAAPPENFEPQKLCLSPAA
jgi:hypothetical protein